MRYASLLLLAACGLAAGTAQAQQNPVLPVQPYRIFFNGEVTNQTCTVMVNGSTADGIVNLPTVSVSDLAGPPGIEAERTPFIIKITNCTPFAANSPPVKIRFVPYQVDANGDIANTELAANNPATGVSVRLYTDADGTSAARVNFNDYQSTDVVMIPNPGPTTTDAERTFSANYISSANTITVGKVTAIVMYSLVYL